MGGVMTKHDKLVLIISGLINKPRFCYLGDEFQDMDVLIKTAKSILEASK